jgi:hypothetical protein
MLNSFSIWHRSGDRPPSGKARPHLRATAIMATLVALALGCTDASPQPTSSATAPAVPAPRPAVERPLKPPPARPRPAAKAPAKPGTPATADRAATPPQSAAAGPVDGVDLGADPARLVGRDEARIRALLGPPAEEQDAAPGKIWRYRTPRCTLDVSLYPDVQGRVFRTLAYEVTSHDHTDQGRRLCLVELQSRTNAASGQ